MQKFYCHQYIIYIAANLPVLPGGGDPGVFNTSPPGSDFPGYCLDTIKTIIRISGIPTL